MTKSKVTLNGHLVDFQQCLREMDEGVMKLVNDEDEMQDSDVTDQQYLDAYVKRHWEELGEDFDIYGE